jgi:hypothetical protein
LSFLFLLSFFLYFFLSSVPLLSFLFILSLFPIKHDYCQWKPGDVIYRIKSETVGPSGYFCNPESENVERETTVQFVAAVKDIN